MQAILNIDPENPQQQTTSVTMKINDLFCLLHSASEDTIDLRRLDPERATILRQYAEPRRRVRFYHETNFYQEHEQIEGENVTTSGAAELIEESRPPDARLLILPGTPPAIVKKFLVQCLRWINRQKTIEVDETEIKRKLHEWENIPF